MYRLKNDIPSRVIYSIDADITLDIKKYSFEPVKIAGDMIKFRVNGNLYEDYLDYYEEVPTLEADQLDNKKNEVTITLNSKHLSNSYAIYTDNSQNIVSAINPLDSIHQLQKRIDELTKEVKSLKRMLRRRNWR